MKFSMTFLILNFFEFIFHFKPKIGFWVLHSLEFLANSVGELNLAGLGVRAIASEALGCSTRSGQER